MTQPFQIVTVCTGNIGRSPMAERLLSHRLLTRLGTSSTCFTVSSAGTEGLDGWPMEEFAAMALVERGVSPAGFRARRLTPELLAPADLVLTATRQHRAEVVAMVPATVRRVFTLKEFARLADQVTVAAGASGSIDPSELVALARARIDLAGRLRGMGETHPDTDDVEDPLGAPLETYRGLADDLDEASLRAVDLLLGPPY